MQVLLTSCSVALKAKLRLSSEAFLGAGDRQRVMKASSTLPPAPA